MKKKILFLITDLNGGGAENVFVQLANHFSIKYEVHFMVLSASGPNLLKLKSNIKIIELKKKKSLYSIFKINHYIRDHNIDIAIGTLAMAYAISLANLFGSKNCKYIARIGSIVSSNLSEKTLIRRLIFSTYQKVLYLSDAIITQSYAMDLDLQKYIKRSSKIIYNPVNSKKILSLSSDELPIKIDDKFFNIISVGRLSNEKDYKTSLLSIAKLKKQIKNIKFYILGEGELKSDLVNLIKIMRLEKEVIFLGYLNNPYPIMKKANVLLLTSLYEGFSNVILESLALNVPVVATNSPGGNKEIIFNGKNGFLTKVGDVDDIVEKLILVKEQKKFQINLEKYELNAIGAEYEKCF